MNFHDELQECIDLRINGYFDEATDILVEVLQRYPKEASIQVESIKLMLHQGSFDDAFDSLKIISDSGASFDLSKEAIYRIQISKQGLQMLPEVEFRSTGADWILHHLDNGEKKHYQSEIVGQSCTTSHFIHYQFTYLCGSCGKKAGAHIKGSLLTVKTTLCPHCFADNSITVDAIRKYIESSRSKSFSTDAYEIDNAVTQLKLEVNDFREESEVPLLAKYLSDNYIHWFNSHLIKLKTTSGDE